MLRYLREEGGRSPRPALFLDRDGVLNRRIVGGYVTDPGELEPLELALEAASAAQLAGAALVVVTNQGAIARGLATEFQVAVVHAQLLAMCDARGISLAAIYTCPHHPQSPDPARRVCGCRKPKPGLILAAAADLNLDLRRAALIGDQPSDIAAAHAAGIVGGRALRVGPDAPATPRQLAEQVLLALR